MPIYNYPAGTGHKVILHATYYGGYLCEGNSPNAVIRISDNGYLYIYDSGVWHQRDRYTVEELGRIFENIEKRKQKVAQT